MMNDQYSITNEGMMTESIDLKSQDLNNRTVNDLRRNIKETTSA
jgi:hypothetical protein